MRVGVVFVGQDLRALLIDLDLVKVGAVPLGADKERAALFQGQVDDHAAHRVKGAGVGAGQIHSAVARVDLEIAVVGARAVVEFQGVFAILGDLQILKEDGSLKVTAAFSDVAHLEAHHAGRTAKDAVLCL